MTAVGRRLIEPLIERQIMDRLAAIESEDGVTIVYACEAGSRAWGFESPDSDYDVRFVYARPRDWYLSFDVERRRDVIERSRTAIRGPGASFVRCPSSLHGKQRARHVDDTSTTRGDAQRTGSARGRSGCGSSGAGAVWRRRISMPPRCATTTATWPGGISASTSSEARCG